MFSGRIEDEKCRETELFILGSGTVLVSGEEVSASLAAGLSNTNWLLSGNWIAESHFHKDCFTPLRWWKRVLK